MTNVLTVDVEDWQQSTVDQQLPISERVWHNTTRLLDLFAETGVHATFFIQTMVAEVYPDLVRGISAAGHEIACHGHGHVPLFRLTRDAFAADLRQSLDVFASLGLPKVIGYRAPDFSIRTDTKWAISILRDFGFRYSSSIFPIAGKRYGIPGTPVSTYRHREGIIEVPLSTVRFVRRHWPVAGGGYLRLLPYFVSRAAIRRINAEQRPAVIYLHPYELDSEEVLQFRGRIPLALYFSQSLNRGRTEGKIRSLLRDFDFAPVQEVISV